MDKSIMDVIEERRSIRNYLEKPIPDELIKQIAKAGRLAPSASNRQPFEFVFVTDRNIINDISVQPFLKKAPLIIIGTVDSRITPKWEKVDLALALHNMVLFSTSVGLGTCYVGWFHSDDIRKACNIPKTHKILLLVSVGYEGKNARIPLDRKDYSETFYLNKWKEPLI
jgi:nitroreductase